ncbi:MAG: hypothetical protein P8168_05420 [Deltaproteobacteria bacterium]|jgi:hypothetical protein
MKKTVSVVLAIAFLLGLGVSGALAYQFDDSTLVQEWRAGAVTGGWQDVIGDASVFDTFGANYSGGILTIFTNWNPGKDGTVDAAVKTADLFIDLCCNGSIDYAIRLDSDGQGNVFASPSYQTSDDIFQSKTNLIYGGQYDMANPKLVPVWATSDSTGSTSVSWGTEDSLNTVAIDLSGLVGEKFGFIWGTATCANDGFSDCVPIPPSVLLMGSGLLGVGLLGWRRRGSEDQVG